MGVILGHELGGLVIGEQVLQILAAREDEHIEPEPNGNLAVIVLERGGASAGFGFLGGDDPLGAGIVLPKDEAFPDQTRNRDGHGEQPQGEVEFAKADFPQNQA